MGLSRKQESLSADTSSKWLTFPKPEKPIAKVRSVENILFIKSPSIRQRKNELSLKDKDVTSVSSQVMVARQDLSITKKPKLRKRLSYVWNFPSASSENKCH